MKLRKIYESILDEGKQVGKVYHFTSLNNAIKIVKTDHLKGFHATKNIKGRTVSTTRDKNFSRRRGDQLSISGADITFELDGNKLSNVYQVMPYDDTYDKDAGEYEEQDRINFGDEQEEVWYGKKLEQDVGFKNFSKYVTKVIITKRFINKVFQKPEKLFVRGEDSITDLFGNVNDFLTDGHGKILEIKKWFEQNGYKVEFEK